MSRKHLLVIAAGALSLAAIGVLIKTTPSTEAATFLIRGDVTKFDKANGNFHLYIRHTNSAAEKYAGETHEIKAQNATFYTYDKNQKKVRSTFGTTIDNNNIEVVVRGTVDDSNQFKATWVVRNDNEVKMRGHVRGHDTSNNYLTVEIDKVLFQKTGKTYKSAVFEKGKSVRVYYDRERTKFKSRDGNTMNPDEISNNDEKITFDKLQVKKGSRLEGDINATITDGKWLF